ncbi:MAG: class I SAM-dependent methyltransferase [Candidatus Hydrogenedentota bacterium]
MESIVIENCPVCENKESEKYCEGDWWEYVKCKKCELLYLKKRLPTSKMYKSYSGGLLKEIRRKLTYPFRKSKTFKNLETSLARCEIIVDEIENFVYPPGKLLDIGCNKGYLIATSLCRGWDAYGIELIPELPMVIKREFCLENKIFIGDISRNHNYFEDNFFDCVSLIDMIEHFEKPVSDLNNLNRILKNNRILFIQTPDFNNILSKIYRSAWGGLNPCEHLCIYNINSIKYLLDKTNYKLIKLKSGIDKYCGNMVVIAEKLSNV